MNDVKWYNIENENKISTIVGTIDPLRYVSYILLYDVYATHFYLLHVKGTISYSCCYTYNILYRYNAFICTLN